ncbi:MAG: hypothetical protein Q9M97_00620 [Candidatus Gracilibacteria bacterium]|nr:hypothetical protein [Candidatus Gracilibacteria bacterium]
MCLKNLDFSSSSIWINYFFEVEDGIIDLFKDILFELKEKKYSALKCISANTFESMSTNNKDLDELSGNFFEELKLNNIKIEGN